jgi:hypothetical protein
MATKLLLSSKNSKMKFCSKSVSSVVYMNCRKGLAQKLFSPQVSNGSIHLGMNYSMLNETKQNK